MCVRTGKLSNLVNGISKGSKLRQWHQSYVAHAALAVGVTTAAAVFVFPSPPCAELCCAVLGWAEDEMDECKCAWRYRPST